MFIRKDINLILFKEDVIFRMMVEIKEYKFFKNIQDKIKYELFCYFVLRWFSLLRVFFSFFLCGLQIMIRVQDFIFKKLKDIKKLFDKLRIYLQVIISIDL